MSVADVVLAPPRRNVASFAVESSIRAFGEGEWDAVARATICSWSYLRALEEVVVADLDRRYFVARDDAGTIVASSYFYVVTLPLEILAPRDHPFARFARVARRLVPRFLTLRVAGCGSATTLGHTISLAPHLDAGEREEIVRRLFAELEAFAQAQGAAGVMLRDFHDEDEPLVAILERLGLARVPNLDDTFLDLRWPAYESWLASLKSHYRRLVEQQTAMRERSGIRVIHTTRWEHLADQMAELFAVTASRHTAGPLVGADYFRAMSDRTHGRLRAALFYSGERLVGFILYFIDDTTILASYLGVDYQVNAEASLIFNAYFEVIRVAIELRRKRIWFGRTAYAAKFRLGAEATPLVMLLRFRSAWMTRFAAKAMHRFVRPEEPRRWNVFKKGTR